MAEDILVTEKIEAGARLLDALDRNGIKTGAALWLHYPDQDSWKLVISPAEKTKGAMDIYMKLWEILRSDACRDLDLAISDIKVMQPDVPLLRALSRTVRAEGNNRIRFSHNVIDGIYIDDAVIYRSAA